MEKDKEITRLQTEVISISVKINEISVLLKDVREQIQKYLIDHDKLIAIGKDVQKHNEDINYMFEKFRLTENRVFSIERWASSAKVYLTLLAVAISAAISFAIDKFFK